MSESRGDPYGGAQLAERASTRIARDAEFLLDRGQSRRPGQGQNYDRRITSESETKSASWRRAIAGDASSDRWRRYRSALKLDDAIIFRCLSPDEEIVPQTPCRWTSILDAVLCNPRHGSVSRQPSPFSDPTNNPSLSSWPCGDLWVSFLDAYQASLSENLRYWSFAVTEEAIRQTRQRLCKHLSLLGQEVAVRRFHDYRSRRLGSLARVLSPGGSQIYLDWVRSERGDNLLGLFENYPVLARQLATRTMQWTVAVTEVLERLDRDSVLISDSLCDHSSFGKLTGILPDLGDFHSHGRSATLLTFESGQRVVYKPRSLQPEETLSKFVDRLNDCGAPIPLVTGQVVNRGVYGWMTFVDSKPCSTHHEVREYYEQLGALLGVLYLLRATDMHMGNLIAAGRHPVVVDYECLMTPDCGPLAPRHSVGIMPDVYEHSVLDIGILPNYHDPSDVREEDLTALGGYVAQVSRVQSTQIHSVNTDTMYLSKGTSTYLPEGNVVHLGDRVQEPADYVVAIVSGFSRTYRFLQYCQKADPEGKHFLGDFEHLYVRILLRDSRVYAGLLAKCSTTARLRNGIDYSLGIEYLARRYLEGEGTSERWSILAAEREALLRGDIPLFHVKASSTVLRFDSGREIRNMLPRAPFQELRARWRGLSDADMRKQIRLIQRAIHTTKARNGSRPSL